MLKSPAAIIAPGTTSDCKNYSLFTGGILDALNRKGAKIPWVYRFSSYRLLDKMPQHVFVVMYPGTNKEIWIDAVLPYYNQHKQYYYKTDRKVKNMSLIALSGIEDHLSIGKRGDKRRNFFKKLKEDIKKAGKFYVKIAAAGPRNAALALIKLNFRSIATNLDKKIQTEPKKVQQFWESIGGNWNKLHTAVDQGKHHKRLGEVDAAIGIEPATTSALIAAGSAVLIAMVSKLGLSGGKDIQDAKDSADKDVIADINKEADGQETKTGDSILKAGGMDFKNIAIIGGAALVGFMLLKKRK
jgi:hypothetical protein